MTDLYTKEFADGLPSLRDLTPEQRRGVVEAGARLYGQVRAAETKGTPFVSRTEIQRWAESNGIGPDEVSAAFAFLIESGQLNAVARDAAPVAEATVVRQSPFDEMTDEEIRALAAEKGIEDAEDLTIRRLKNRIRKLEAGGAEGSVS